MSFYQAAAAVHFPKFGLFDLAGWVSGNIGKDNPVGAFISGQFSAKLVYIVFCTGKALFDGDHRSGNLTQTLVGKADNRHIVNRLVGTQEIFNLNRIQILTRKMNPSSSSIAMSPV